MHAARLLSEARAGVLEANQADVVAAKADGLSGPMFDRLVLKEARLEGLVKGLHEVASLPDPLGRVNLDRQISDSGPVLQRVSCPIGVLLVIFESRPDAVVQIASLCIKSGNSVILKGGKEAARSSAALVELVLRPALELAGLNPDMVQLVQTRESVGRLLELDSLIDLVIPRGSAALVKSIKEATRIPVMGHSDGLCAVYLHSDADKLDHTTVAQMVVDSKTQYPAACNSAETLLVHEESLNTVFPLVAASLISAGVTLRCDELSMAAVRAGDTEILSKAASIVAVAPTPGNVEPAEPTDWDTEWLGPTMSVKAVRDLPGAVEHINTHGSGHTDSIVTADPDGAGAAFTSGVASSSVFVNMSTRFADGYRYGFGAEVGISTARLHARGPVGVEGLTTYKYIARGAGHCVALFEGGGALLPPAVRSAYHHVDRDRE
jgi:glutamate-5-semialdehyde dehydrogenase